MANLFTKALRHVRRLVRGQPETHLAENELARLQQKVAKLEMQLSAYKERNAKLADQLRQQREKIQDLYRRTKLYAARLTAKDKVT